MTHDQLHEYLKDAISEIRRRGNEVLAPEFRLDIEVSGRVASGEPRIAYKLNIGGGYNSDMPTGARLASVIDEAVRRYQWGKRNDPLALPAPDDEIQF